MTRNIKIKFSGGKCLSEFLEVSSELKSTQIINCITLVTDGQSLWLHCFTKFARTDIRGLTAFLCIFAVQVLLNDLITL